MAVISIFSGKGGVGKSTLLISLAVAAHQAGIRSVLIDADPQATILKWARLRTEYYPDEAGLYGVPPEVIAVARGRIGPMIERLYRDGAELILLDLPGRNDAGTAMGLQSADLVLIPGRPRIIDLDPGSETVAACMRLGVSFAYLFNMVPPRGTRNLNEARATLEQAGLAVCPFWISNRAAFADSYDEGLGVTEYDPDDYGSDEIGGLFNWICHEVGL